MALANLIKQSDIQRGSGYAYNPATGKLEQAFARMAPNENDQMDWTDYSFDPTGRQSLAGWAPGYYTDNGSGGFKSLFTEALPLFAAAYAGGAGLGALGAGAAGTGSLAGTAGWTAGVEGAAGAGGLSGAGGAGAAGLGGAAAAPTLLADAGGVMDAPIAWDTAAAAAPAPPPTPMSGYDLGGGLSVDAAGGVSGGAFAGGPGTAGAADFASPASWLDSAKSVGSSLASIPGASKLTDGLTLKYLLDKASKAAPAALGAYGANEQAQAYRDMSDKYLGIGAPSRDRYEASFQPGFSMANEPGYADALAQTTKETLHQLSPSVGNPAASPNAWAQTLKDVNSKFAFPALDNYRRLNGGMGGLAALTSAAPGADNSSIRAQGGVYDALGAGAADVFNPPQTAEEFFRQLRKYSTGG